MQKLKKFILTKTQTFRYDTLRIGEINKIFVTEFFIQVQLRAFFNQLFNGNDAKCLSCSSTTGNIINPNTIQIQSKRINNCNCTLLAQKNNYVVCPKCNLAFFTLKENDVICPLCNIQFCRLCRQFQQLYLSSTLQCNCYRLSNANYILLFFVFIFLQLTFGLFPHIIERYGQLKRSLRRLKNWYIQQEQLSLKDWISLPLIAIFLIFWYTITILPTHFIKSCNFIKQEYLLKIAN